MTPAAGTFSRMGLMLGDITTVPAEAIVNAANRMLVGGGGVDGAIHRAAGHGLYLECLSLGGCDPGDAKISGGHNLRARLVIHTVGPEWTGGSFGEDGTLASCYRRSLELAAERGVRTLAFPSIGTGAFGFPLDRAAAIAVREILAFLETHDLPERVTLVCFDPETLRAHQAALKAVTSLDSGCPGYQNRNLKKVSVNGVEILEAPRPPYYSFHGTPAKGLQPLEPSVADPIASLDWGLITVASFAEAQRRAGLRGEVHALYIHTGHYCPFDARPSRNYGAREAQALGICETPAPITGAELLSHLIRQHGGGTGPFLASLGWTGLCFEQGGTVQWAIWTPDCIKRTRAVSNPEEARTLEAFAPESLPKVGLSPLDDGFDD